MSGLVIDSSVALAAVFDDETSDYADSAIVELRESPGLVPSLWLLEVGNALLVAERRGRIDEFGCSMALELLRELPLRVEQDLTNARLDRVVALARRRGISSYDAAYLEMAIRLSIPLATLDERLRAAARAEGIQLFQPQL